MRQVIILINSYAKFNLEMSVNYKKRIIMNVYNDNDN